MGLAEKRALKRYQEDIYPAQQARVSAAAGFEVPIEVDWASLAIPERDHLYEEGWTSIYFDTLVTAFEAICEDQMGQEALQSALQKVVLRNSGEGKYDAGALSFEDGVLEIDHDPFTKIGRVEPRRDALVELLERSL